MRHRVRGRKLGRTSSQRKALMRSLARSLILNEEGRITTTISKAKEVRPFVEKLITLSRENVLYKRQRAHRIIPDHEVVNRLFEDIGPRYTERDGGYLRIIRWDKRLGDKAERAVVEFVTDDVASIPDDKADSDESTTVAASPENSEKASSEETLENSEKTDNTQSDENQEEVTSGEDTENSQDQTTSEDSSTEEEEKK